MKYPRKYQIDLHAKIIASFKKHDTVMAVLPTGGGKTFVASLVAKHMKPVLWIAHRNKLLSQARIALTQVGMKEGIDFELQSISAKISNKKFKLAIYDEAPHEAAQFNSWALNQVKCDKLLGLSATPFRHDSLPLRFQKQIIGTKILDLIKENYLARPTLYSVRWFNDKKEELADWLNLHIHLSDHWLIFVQNYDEARDFLQKLDCKNKIIIKPGDENDDAKMHHKVIITVDLILEGSDYPWISGAIILRNTKSIPMLKQMIGRVIRNTSGKLKRCTIVQPVHIIKNSLPNFKNLVPIFMNMLSTKQEGRWATKSISI